MAKLKKTYPLGQIVITANAAGRLDRAEVASALARHAEKRNTGARGMTVVTSVTGDKFWVITDLGRAVTTVLMPEDN